MRVCTCVRLCARVRPRVRARVHALPCALFSAKPTLKWVGVGNNNNVIIT
jgi:hypothetical protein